MSVERIANTVSTTTNATYTAGDTSLTVTATGAFPNSGNFRIIVVDGSNNILVTLKVTVVSSSTVFATTPEGADAGSPISGGASVYLAETAGGLTAFIADCRQFGVDGSLPTTTNQKVGNQYQATDGPYDYYFNGSVWVPRGPVWNLTKPILANYSGTRNTSGSATITDTAAGILFSNLANSSGTLVYAYFAEPAAPYTLTLLTKGIGVYDGSHVCAPMMFGWRNSGTSKLEWIGNFVYNSTPGGYIACERFTDDSTFSTEDASFKTPFHQQLFLQLHRASTTYSFKFSVDGVTFINLYDMTNATTNLGGAPDQIIFGMAPAGNSQVNHLGTAISLVQA